MSVLLTLLLPGCGDTSAGSTGPEDSFPCSAIGNVELIPLDIWGRDLAESTLASTLSPDTVALVDVGPGVVMYPLGASPVDLALRWSAADHADLATTIRWSGPGSFAVDDPTAVGRVAWSWDATRSVGGTTCPVLSVYAGLEHTWFAPSAAAPTRNAVELHMDGESYWADVAAGLARTERRVTWTTWWWESDFELVRGADHAELTEAERWEYTALGLLEGLSGVERRVLINRFWAENSDFTLLLNSDEALRDYAETPGDAMEVVLQGNDTEVPIEGQYTGEPAAFSFAGRVAANPRYSAREVEEASVWEEVDLELQVASWHQKSIVLDGEVAFVSGMNTKSTDWDSSDHAIFDARRMEFEATEAERADVSAQEELPDLGPRKDYGVRVEGPAAHDVEDILATRWNAAIDAGDAYAEYATELSLDGATAESGDGAQVQVVATMPEPWGMQAILETHARALANADRYVFIEDQYFRAPLLNDVLVERMLADDDLLLIVVTMDVATTDGGAKFSWLSDQTFRALFPDRYLLLQLGSIELVTDPDAWWDEAEIVIQPIDTHSKLRIVDDRYLSVGSCNFNNRGYLYEGELDVAVLDEAFATDARARVFANLVGDEWSALLSDDAQNNFDVLSMVAGENEERLSWWEDNVGDLDADEAEQAWSASRPSGFVYPLQIQEGYEWDVGPDAF